MVAGPPLPAAVTGPDTPGLLERLLRLGLRLGRIMTPTLAWRLGAMLGDAFARLPGRDQRRCREHLAKAFPGRPPAEIAHLQHATFRHFGRMALWTLATLHRPAAEMIRSLAVEGAENLQATLSASSRGEPTVAFAAHFGNWELLARIGGTLAPLTMIGRRMRHPGVDRIVRSMRTGEGGRLIHQEDGLRPCLRELKAGRVISTLTDQDIPRLAGVFVPWFGDLAFTPAGPAALSILADCPVQPIYLFERGGRWVIHWGPRVKLPRSGDRDADILAVTTWTTQYLERMVRRMPTQWVWWHRRWRTRPTAS